MGDVINLNQFRKRKTNEQNSARSAANRQKFGRTRLERKRDEDEGRKRDKTLDDSKLTPEDSPRDA